jgi:hypothetical protein
MLEERRAKLSLEEWRRWGESMLTELTRTEIGPISRPDDDGERG